MNPLFQRFRTVSSQLLRGRLTGRTGAFLRRGLAALDRRVPLSELRRADATGLEDLFFSLTGHDTTEEAAA